MRVNRSIGPAALLAGMSLSVPALGGTVIAQWNFNGSSTAAVPGGASSPALSVGLGTASLVGGVVGTFADGAAGGGSSDPITSTPTNYAWGAQSFPSQSTGSGSAGVQFAVSTAGLENIVVSWDTRFFNTASRFIQLLYSLDGSTFSAAGLANGGLFEHVGGGDSWSNGISFGLNSINGVANNAMFTFRIVTVFSPTTGLYEAANPTSSYSPVTGKLRFDMVTVTGSVVPAPGALAFLIGAARSSRRRK
jgi:hypothetical protein